MNTSLIQNLLIISNAIHTGLVFCVLPTGATVPVHRKTNKPSYRYALFNEYVISEGDPNFIDEIIECNKDSKITQIYRKDKLEFIIVDKQITKLCLRTTN